MTSKADRVIIVDDIHCLLPHFLLFFVKSSSVFGHLGKSLQPFPPAN